MYENLVTYWKRWLLLVGMTMIFIATRLWFSYHMPIINDEPLYVDYMQHIHEDRNQHKWISVDNIYNDWKPPLQYWYWSLFVDVFQNPIYSARLSSIVIWLFSFFVLLLFVWFMTQSFLALCCAWWLYILHPIALSNNTMVLAEWLVSFFLLCSMLMLWIFVFYRKKLAQKSYFFMRLFLYILVLFSLFYTKQTGDLFVLLQIPIYIVFMIVFYWTTDIRDCSLKNIVWDVVLVLLSSFLSYILYKYSFPDHIYVIKSLFSNQYWYTYSFTEIAHIPLVSWLKNIYQTFQYLFAYYWLLIICLWISACAVTVVVTQRYRTMRSFLASNSSLVKFRWMVLLFAWISLSFVLTIKNFPAQWQKVIQYTSELFVMIVTLFMVAMYQCYVQSRSTLMKGISGVLLIWLSYTLFFWWRNMIYNSFVEYDIAYSYAYKTQQCLKNQNCNWGSHIDMDKMLHVLNDVNSTEKEYCIFTDSQWWHPGMLVKVMIPMYDNLKLCGDLWPQIDTYTIPSHSILIFDSKRDDRWLLYAKSWWDDLLKSWYCWQETYTRTKWDSNISNVSLCIYNWND